MYVSNLLIAHFKAIEVTIISPTNEPFRFLLKNINDYTVFKKHFSESVITDMLITKDYYNITIVSENDAKNALFFEKWG